MPVQFNSPGARQTFFSKPANTTANTIYTCAVGAGGSATLDSINIACTGACNITIWLNNGTTDYPLLDAFAVSANTSEQGDFGQPTLRDGWSIKVMTSNADDATFTAVVAEEIR